MWPPQSLDGMPIGRQLVRSRSAGILAALQSLISLLVNRKYLPSQIAAMLRSGPRRGRSHGHMMLNST